MHKLKLALNVSLFLCLLCVGVQVAVAATQTASPSTCVNDTSIGTQPWSNPVNAGTSDNIYATSDLVNSQITNYLKCTGYNFTLPAGAIVNGITVAVEDHSQRTIYDYSVRLVKAGTIQATDYATNTNMSTADSYVTYGGATNLWGTTWSATDINNANFGVAFAGQRGPYNTTDTAFVDHIQVTVTYTFAGPPTVVTGAASAVAFAGATLNGTVSSNGSSTTVTFDYGLDTGYTGGSVTASASPLGASASNTAVSAALSGLNCATIYHYRAKGVNASGTSYGADQTFTTSACPVPNVVSITTASPNPTVANTSVSWSVLFDMSVTGVDATDFAFVTTGNVTGATVTSVTGSGASYTVTANTGTGTTGTLRLKLSDNDTIKNVANYPLGGSGLNNGDFTGEVYTLVVAVCDSSMLFCDDFERSVAAGGTTASTAVGTAPGYGAWSVSSTGNCTGVNGNAGCAGIDSDVPPWNSPTAPRAVATSRAMFTRWQSVTVTSPVINLAGRSGAEISFWLRRGSDCFSEWPGNNQAGCGATLSPYTSTSGEEFRLEYKNSAGAWVSLVQYPSDGPPGEVDSPTILLPSDALHANFQFRFVQPAGSGSNGTNGGAPGVRGYDYWHVDDVVMKEVPLASYSGPFCDNFEGDLARWSITGLGNARIGSVYFANGAHNMDMRWNTEYATSRAVDLSTNSGNDRIIFWVKRGIGNNTRVPNTAGSDFPETGKSLRVDYLNSLGNWVTLTTFNGGGTAGQVYSAATTPTTNSFAIPADAKHTGFRLRFSLLAGAMYDQDYWHIDDVCVGTTLGSTDLSVTKNSSGVFSPGQYVNYAIAVTNNGPNPVTSVTITDTLPVSPSTGLPYLNYTGVSAGWTCTPSGANGEVRTCTNNAGLAVGATTTITLTATVDGAAAGTITNKAEVGSQGTDDPNLANNTAYKADTIFVPGYAFTNRECTLGGGPLGTGAQCSEISWQPQTSGIPLKNIYITAVDSAGNPIQLDPTNPTTVNMQFGLACIDPANHAGVPATFTGASTGSNLNGAIPLCQSGGAANWSVGAGLIFAATKTSVGPYTFNYNDVGKVELLMRNSAATTQLGSSGNFDVVPHHFGIAGIPAGPHKAGNDIAPTVAPFATVTAYNGLATPTATPNFGKESAPESATLSFVRCQPAGAAASGGAFTSAVGSFTAGVADITTLNWSEVGNGDLVATLTSGSYLGSGRTVTGNTGSSGTPCQDPGGAAVAGNVGVFIPDHFDVAVADGCVGCGFTYSGQPFDVTVTARNAFNATTVNYDGVATTPMFAHAVQLADANAVAPPPGKFSAANAQALANVDGTTLTIPVAGFTSGVATLTRVPTYTFGVTPAAPATLKMRAVDTSYVSVSSVGFAEGTTVIRSGRYRIANAHGSELLPLPIAVAVQYYNGASWLTSTTDNVTSFNSDLTANGGNLISTPVKGALAINVANAGASQVAGGVRTITLAAPGAAGSVDLTLNAPTYLLGGSNIAGANPSNAGRATFGIYKGANEFIYQRENY